MTAPFRLTQRALDDLDSIWDFIASDSVDAANRVERAILASCEKLGKFPMLGVRRPEITAKLVRFWTVPKFPNFIIVYRPDRSPIHILTILHGMRDIKQILSGPEVH